MEDVQYPDEVWAVEYTTVSNQRRVEVVGSKEEAMAVAASAPTADPFILRSDAKFERVL